MAHIKQVGVDEVGRGPLFGRVYSACVILPKHDECPDFNFDLFDIIPKAYLLLKMNENSS